MAHTLNAANHAAPWSVALVGNPNCGKTALFNLLTGARQKVANYAGVTVERKVGTAKLKNGRTVSVVDLPGAYSLTPAPRPTSRSRSRSSKAGATARRHPTRSSPSSTPPTCA